jgi:hypothetical protein
MLQNTLQFVAVLVVGALSTEIHERAEIITKHNACRGERFTFQNAHKGERFACQNACVIFYFYHDAQRYPPLIMVKDEKVKKVFFFTPAFLK